MNPVTSYLSVIGKKGGEAKSKAKRAASRVNGKLGGYPKGRKRSKRT